MPRYFKYFVIYNFYVMILLLYSSIVGDIFCWALILVKKCWSAEIIDLVVLSLK